MYGFRNVTLIHYASLGFPDGITEDWPDYLPTLTWAEVNAEVPMCMEMAPHGELFFGCSRHADHEGDHAAHTGPYLPGRMVARWPRA